MGFKLYLAKRGILAFITVIIVMVVTFTLIHAAPGDPTDIFCAEDTPLEEIELIRARWGLDRPLYEQFMTYLGNVFRGDLGYSYIKRAPVAQLILERLPNTAMLAVSSTMIGVTLGVVFGVLSSRKPHSLLDNILSTVSLTGISLPCFWVAQLFIIVFAVYLGLFPSGGMTSPRLELTGINFVIDRLYHLILPSIAMGFFQIGSLQRNVRACMLEALGKDYITWARAKGLSETVVFFKHALRNVMLPIVTLVGMGFARLFGGAVVIETIFSWPGLGKLMMDAIRSRDYPLVLGDFVFMSSVIVMGMIIVDILYSFFDPRVTHR